MTDDERYLAWLASVVERIAPSTPSREATHWAPGFQPRTEWEYFMGHHLDPLEEIEVKRHLAALLKLETSWRRIDRRQNPDG